MGSKTPVSILQEMLMRQGRLPQYDLIYDGTATHEAIFKYRVTAGDISAIGSGRSKKEAKHEAAKTVIERLAESNASIPVPEIEEEMKGLSSPYKDKVTENAIGALQDLCVTNEIPMAEYDLVGDEGPPHARQFTIVCTVNKIKETAVGWTKKQAKQLAASYMLTRVREMVGNAEEQSTRIVSPSKKEEKSFDPESQTAINKYLEIGGQPGRRTCIGLRASDMHLCHMYIKSDRLEQLRQKTRSLDTDTLETLETIAKEMDVPVLWEEVPSMSGQIIFLLVLQTVPDIVVCGSGPDETVAKQVAAKHALEYLLIMTFSDNVKE